MPLPPRITEEYLYAHAPNAKAAQAGQALARDNSFSEARWTADGLWLAAGRAGSLGRYTVSVDLIHPSSLVTDCDCPSYQQPCKHALGLLFLALEKPQTFRICELPKSVKRGRQARPSRLIVAEEAEEEQDPRTLEESFLRSIREEPAELAHRLIYADWLDEDGDEAGHDRAEFIRVQCRLADAALDPASDEAGRLRQREEALWKKHRVRWIAELPQALRRRTVVFHRGFLEEMALTVPQFLRYADVPMEHFPLHRVRFTGHPDKQQLSQLAGRRELARLTAIDLSGTEVGTPEMLRRLLDTPFLSKLEQLDLSGNNVTYAGVRALTEIARLSNLRWLNLSRNELGDTAAEYLARCPYLANLTTLDLHINGIGAAGAAALAASPHLGRLTRLDLRDNKVGRQNWDKLRERFGDALVTV